MENYRRLNHLDYFQKAKEGTKCVPLIGWNEFFTTYMVVKYEALEKDNTIEEYEKLLHSIIKLSQCTMDDAVRCARSHRIVAKLSIVQD